MEDMKNLLTVTLVVMAAGSSIYTIKTFMKPGMDLNINLEENHHSSLSLPMHDRSVAEAIVAFNQTFPLIRENSVTTELPFGDIENNTIAELIFSNNKSDSLIPKIFTDRRRSLLVRDKAKLNEIVKKIRKFENKDLNKFSSEIEIKKFNQTETEIELKKEPEIENDAFVATMLGKIQGTQLNVLGRKVNAFLGVPYAQPPVDSLRFARPLPITSWNETINATQFGPACIQHIVKDSTFNQEIKEDCLNINIWTPSKGKGHYPVMFFIHGGNFISGSNSADEADGRVLAALQNVIVVSPNYRLGPLGFFSIDGNSNIISNDSSIIEKNKSLETLNETNNKSKEIFKRDGNYGLWDLVEALKWTRANIVSFGGSADSITLVGQSSGALAASLLLISPETAHLSNRAILQSGSSTVFNFYYQQSQRSSEEFSTLLGCMKATEQITMTNFKTISACVHSKSESDILKATDKQLSQKLYAYSPRMGDELFPFMPNKMLEKLKNIHSKNDDNFLKKQILIGTNAFDVPFFFNMGYPHLFTKKTPTLKDLEEVRQFLAASLKDWGISRRTLRLINSFFLERSTTLEPKTLMKAMHDIFGDLTFSCPSIFFAERFTTVSNTSTNNTSLFGNAYFYSFNRNNSAKDEMPFVFGHPLRYANDYNGTDIDLSKRIMNFWSNFARSGNPGSIDLTSGNWLSYDIEKQWFLDIGTEVRLAQRPAASMTRNFTEGSNSSAQKLNCDTWKHAFKIFN